MDIQRHNHNKTVKKVLSDNSNQVTSYTINNEHSDTFKNLLEDSAREAYSRPWHRLERGLRLNRIRIYIEDMSHTQAQPFTKEEKDNLFQFLQKSHDKKLLNTLKVVQYDPESQRIISIKGLDIKRNTDGVLKWTISAKVSRTDTTRKKKKDDNTTNE